MESDHAAVLPPPPDSDTRVPIDDATHVAGADGRYTATIRPGYSSASGIFGGYVASIVLRAAAHHGSKLGPTDFSCNFVSAATPGAADLAVATLVETPRSELISATLTQAGSPVVSATAWFNDERDGIDHCATPVPNAPPAELLRPLGEVHRGFAGFWFLEARPLYEPSLAQPAPPPMPWPRSQLARLIDTTEPRLRAWVRLRPRATFTDPALDWARAVLAVDWLIPFVAAARDAEDRLVLHSTQSLAVSFHTRPMGEWLYCDARAGYARAGIAHGRAEVWSEDGSLVATAMQQMVQRIRL